MSDAYFVTTDGARFVPTDLARGPWDADACHAGPPTGLMVRAMERALDTHDLARITVDLLRPIPMSGFRVEATIVRSGRQVAHSEAMIVDGDDVVARARGLHLRGRPVTVPEPATRGPRFEDATSGRFPIHTTVHGLAAFPASVEVRYDPAHSQGDGGETIMWMRTLVPLLAGEEPSPFQRIAPLADCGNGISYNAYLDEAHFVNPDLTVWLHRPPGGEWHASHAVSHWHPSGVGVAEAVLFDTTGPVGGAVQTLLLFPPR